jgi:GTPase SAR1 family protein
MDFIRQISNQRAIEALRNGVPNHDAVKALGCNQPEIEEAFMIQLRKAEEAMQSGQGKNSGIIIAGDFGSGKSHLLEYLTQVAFKQNFVCSRIVISKETPLFDPARLYRAAAESAVISGKRGNAMTEVITSLANKLGTRDYDSLYQWTHNDAGINAVFGAILHLYRLLSNDPEVRNRIIQFLNGDKINIAEIRRLLRICGDQAAYRFDKTSALDFAMQKFKSVF